MLIRAYFRVLFGFCPECNSDAPKLYDCPICEYNSIPKKEWMKRFKLWYAED